MIRDLLSDLRYSLRMLRRSPVFSSTAVAALTLGIGANTAIFTVVNAVLLKRLPYPDSDRIVILTTRTPTGAFAGASPTKLNLWKELGGAFRDVSGYRFRFFNLRGGAKTEQISVGEVSTDFFRLFGASFERGRAFTADEERPAGGHVAILSARFVRRHFGLNTNPVGQTIRLDRDAYGIVGVLDPAFDGETLAGPVLGNPDVWIPLQLDPSSRDQTNNMVAAARLVAGTTVESGKSQLELATQQFRQIFPGIIGPNDTFSVEVLRDSMVQDVRRSLLVFQGAVGFVLLIACANVASLLLVRSTARAREIAVKAALGAGRSRIVRQLLTESLVLSTLGGVLGLTLGILGMEALAALYPGNLAWIGGVSSGAVDKEVLGFTTLVTVMTGILAGLFPALHASGFDLNLALKEGNTPVGSGARHDRVRSLLVAAEVALALVLLVGAALLARTFLALRAVNPGFDPNGVLTLRMSLDDAGLTGTAGVAQLVHGGIQRLSRVPEVMVASVSCCMPMENDLRLRFLIVGRPLEGAYHGMGSWRSVSPAYFDALKIPLVRGRLFTEQDRLGAPGVVLVNQTMARQLWPGGDPLNDSLLIGKGLGPQFASEPTRRIVGIVGDVRDAALDSEPRPTTYVPIAQLPDGVMEKTMGPLPLTWIVRTLGESQGLSRRIQDELERDSSLPVTDVQSLSGVMRGATSDSNFYFTIMGVLAGAALVLAAIGLNGVMRYAVQQRTKEIGVRMALGAEPTDVRNMMVSQAMRLTLLAIAVGIVGAFALTRLMTNFLFGVTERDPLVFVGVPVVVFVVAFVALWLPARTIARLDTIRALRSE
jgi:putative ABC transport system permease protein